MISIFVSTSCAQKKDTQKKKHEYRNIMVSLFLWTDCIFNYQFVAYIRIHDTGLEYHNNVEDKTISSNVFAGWFYISRARTFSSSGYYKEVGIQRSDSLGPSKIVASGLCCTLQYTAKIKCTPISVIIRIRREQIIINRSSIGHSNITRPYLITNKEPKRMCHACNTPLTIEYIIVNRPKFASSSHPSRILHHSKKPLINIQHPQYFIFFFLN